MRSSAFPVVGFLLPALAFGLLASCGDGNAPGGTGRSDASDGAGRDGSDAAPPDRPPGLTCPAAAVGELRALGACCTADAGCATGKCWNGFCTKSCAADSDCGAAVAPSPLPAGTILRCATNMLGAPFNLCIPGSLAACDGAPDSCPVGEGCALGVDRNTLTPGVGLVGACMTRLVAEERAPAGHACDEARGPYQCEDQGGYRGTGCLARRCTQACTSGRMDTCPSGMFCEGAVSAGFLAFPGGSRVIVSGSGLCVGRPCGQVQALAIGAVASLRAMGADSLCPAGEICVPTIDMAPGDAVRLTCVAPAAGGAYGAPCSRDPAAGMRCKDDALCVEPGGKASAAFCSTLCRRDDDCPAESICLDYPSVTVPNGQRAQLGMCTPKSRVPGTPCKTEKDCAAGEGCNRPGDRTTFFVCRLRGAPDPAGLACNADADCASSRRCVPDPAATSGPSGKCTDVAAWKAIGDACAADGQCRSGDCRDRDLLGPNPNRRTYCSGPCLRNSECGPAQACRRVIFGNNGTPEDPTDDAVYGYCIALTVPAAGDACTGDAACVTRGKGADTCDVSTGACYKKDVKTGAPCTDDEQCDLRGRCAGGPRFAGGACLQWGCDPTARSGVDACPGADAVCKQRFQDDPLLSCYESCSTTADCDRAAERYRCEKPKPTDPAESICLSTTGDT